MKRVRLLLSLVLLVGLYSILTAQQSNLSDYEKKRHIERNAIKMLIDNGRYDSALSYCSFLRKSEKLSYDDLEKAQATIYWLKGDKNTAYQYVLNATDYLLKTNAGSHAFSNMLHDYDYAYPLATDSFLEQMITHKIEDFYLKQDFPEAATGYKFILLDYQLQKYMARYRYDLKQTADSSLKILPAIQHKENLTTFRENFLGLIKQHDHLLTWKEAGPGYKTLITFLSNAGDSALHLQIQPYFEQGLKNNALEPYQYVDQLVWIAALKEKDPVKLEKFHDSLCVVYNCEPLRQEYPTPKGDTIRILSDYTFGLPQ